MKVTNKARALLHLRQILQESTQDALRESRERLLSDALPPNLDELSPRFADTRMLKQRNACISAEFRRIIREDPPDTSNVKQELNAFYRNFALIDTVDFPSAYNTAEQGEGIACSVIVENCGKKYCWGKDNAEPIVLELSVSPCSNFSGENAARTWYAVFDTSIEGNAVPEDAETNANADKGKKKRFPLSVPHEALSGLEAGDYIVAVRMYESALKDGVLTSRSKEFLSRSGNSWELKIY